MNPLFLYINWTISFALLMGHSYSQPNASLEKKAKQLIIKLKDNGDYPSIGKDTLIDLNGDHFKDLLVEYYGLSGTGLKNRVTVYLYDDARKKFKRCDQLCDLANPAFYFDKKIVTGYYVALGGGYAAKLKWKGLRLDSLEKIEVDVQSKGNKTSFKITSFDFIAKKTTFIVQDQMTLPKEYKYWDYTPLIKRNYR